MASKYFKPIKYLGGAGITVLIFGLLIFPILSEGLFSESTQDEVLVRSIPFVAVFITIILMMILTGFMIAMRFNGRVPYRTFHPIELTQIAGIIIGVICLFQPWHIVAYEYGFILLLVSALSFIIWSHVRPQSAQAGKNLPPFTSKQHLIGAVAGLVVLVILAVALAVIAKPEEPYGYTQRQWERGFREEQRAEIIEEQESTYQNFTIPFFIVFSAFPGAIVYFAMREITTPGS